MYQMLTVKNAIERVVQGQLAVCLSAVAAGHYTRAHFIEMAEFVEKFVASLYVSGQIDREFSIETSLSALRLTIRFSVRGHHGIVDNMLPAQIASFAPRKPELIESEIPLPDITYTEFDDFQEAVSQFNAEKNLIKEQQIAAEYCIKEDPAITAYEHAKKFVLR
jgi:hypothetical protein